MVGTCRPILLFSFRSVTVLHGRRLEAPEGSRIAVNGAGCLDNDPVSGCQPVGEDVSLDIPLHRSTRAAAEARRAKARFEAVRTVFEASRSDFWRRGRQFETETRSSEWKRDF